jgi:hypothetical protein
MIPAPISEVIVAVARIGTPDIFSNDEAIDGINPATTNTATNTPMNDVIYSFAISTILSPNKFL